MSAAPQPIQTQAPSAPPGSPKWAVQAPDGKVIQFPDQFTDQDVSREMTKMYPQQDALTQQTNATAKTAGIQNPGQSGIPPNPFQSFLRGGAPMPPGAAQIEQKGEQLDRLGFLQNRAEQSPTPVTNAASVIYPAASTAPWLRGLIPSTENAGANFSKVMSAAGSKPVAISDELSGALSKYQQLVDAGGSRSMAVNKLLSRVTDPSKGALNYEEARMFASNISRLSADEAQRLTPVMKSAVGGIRAALNNTVQQTATGAGVGPEYSQAMSEYAKAARLKGVGQDILQQAKSKLPWLATIYGGKKIVDALQGTGSRTP